MSKTGTCCSSPVVLFVRGGHRGWEWRGAAVGLRWELRRGGEEDLGSN